MSSFTPSLDKLIEQFAKLPSVGKKSAQRLAFHILSMSDAEAKTFTETIEKARTSIRRCEICCNLTDSNVCNICSSKSRDKSVICVVEDSRDVIAIERTHEYNGLYHVLHGAISPMNDINPEDICIKELIMRLGSDDVKEIIMATNPSIEGEATAMYISNLFKNFGIKVTRIAHGLPVGGELEYADEITLTRALEGRQEI